MFGGHHASAADVVNGRDGSKQGSYPLDGSAGENISMEEGIPPVARPNQPTVTLLVTVRVDARDTS